jgi:hypothetical protein
MTIPVIDSKRERIMTEIRKRLAVVFPESQIDRGFLAQNVDTYDRFFLFDLPETCTLSGYQRGQYQCQFAISISYFIKLAQEEVFPVGNMLLEKIRLAIETDENMKDVKGNALVLSMRMEEGALIWYDEGVLDVVLMFVVEYTKDAGWVSNPFK